MTAEGSAARLVRNVLASGAGVASGVLVGLVLTPFIINRLGLDGYGIFALALSLSFLGGYASLTDLGVEASTARYVAEARSRNDSTGTQTVVASALALYMAIALVAAPLLAVLSGPLVQAFGVTDQLADEARLCFVFIAVQLLFELPARAFLAVLQGAQRFTVLQAIELARVLAQAAGFVAVLLAGYGVASLGAVMAFTSALVLMLGAVTARRVVPGLRVSPRLASRTALRSLVSFGGGLVVIRLLAVIYRQMDKVIIGVALGVASVAVFEIANRISAAASLVRSVATPALLPTTAYLREHRDTLRDLYLRGTTYASAAAIPVVIAAFVFAEPLIRAWVGDGLTDAATPTRLLLVYLVPVSLILVGVSMVTALGRLRFLIGIGAANLLINFSLSVALVEELGVNGVVLGTVVAQAIAFVPMQWFLMREFDVGAGQWLRHVVVPLAPAMAVQAAVSFPLLMFAQDTSSILVVAACVALSVSAFFATFYFVGLRPSERAELSVIVAGALGVAREPVPAQEEAEAVAPGPELIPGGGMATEGVDPGDQSRPG